MKKLIHMCDFFTTIIVAGVLYSGCLTTAEAQCSGVFPPNTVCGNSTTNPAPPTAIPGGTTGGNNTWTGDQLFASGRPWCDVRAKGAVGDNVTDDHNAILACYNQLVSN